MNRRPLLRPWLISAGVGLAYLGGILWAVARMETLPPWLDAHFEVVAMAWLAPFLAANIWLVIQLFRVPLKVVAEPEAARET
jgi:hypothetical protein